MANYAIIRTGGKQYRATPGSQLTIEKIGGPKGSEISFDQVLLVRDENGVTVGAPTVANASVIGTIVQQTRDNKLLIHKHKRRKKYRVTRGHRQYITRVWIDSIQLDGASAAPAIPEIPAEPSAPPPPPAAEAAEATEE